MENLCFLFTEIIKLIYHKAVSVINELIYYFNYYYFYFIIKHLI